MSFCLGDGFGFYGLKGYNKALLVSKRASVRVWIVES